jgi:hypothetical protein
MNLEESTHKLYERYRPPLSPQRVALRWTADEAWHMRRAWQSLARFPHPQPNDDGFEFSDSCQVCWRTMRWHNGRSRRSRNLYSEDVCKGSETEKGRGRIAFHSGQEIDIPPEAGYIRADLSCHPIFRLQNSGGP